MPKTFKQIDNIYLHVSAYIKIILESLSNFFEIVFFLGKRKNAYWDFALEVFLSFSMRKHNYFEQAKKVKEKLSETFNFATIKAGILSF